MSEEPSTLRYLPGDDDQEKTETFLDIPDTAEIPSLAETYTPLLICMNGPQKGQRFKITTNRIVLGRSREVDIIMTEAGISRLHAAITCENSGQTRERPICYLEDLQSRNGTELNGSPIRGKVLLKERDRITIGRTTLGYFIRDEEELHSEEILYESATRDPLTGLENRRQLLSHMRHHMALAGRNKIALCLIMIDIDDFKQVNDRHGHHVGDRVLVHAAKVLASCVRESDLLARWGGEEFSVCLPQSTLENAYFLGERLRQEVRENPYQDGDLRIPITVSLGISSFKNDDSTSNLFERADACLYMAKKAGKDQIVLETALE